jgi:hypothetical protein
MIATVAGLLMDNAVDLTPFIGPFAVSASGFSGECAPWTVAVSSPGDLCQTTREEFLTLFQSLGHQEAVQIPGHRPQGGLGCVPGMHNSSEVKVLYPT